MWDGSIIAKTKTYLLSLLNFNNRNLIFMHVFRLATTAFLKSVIYVSIPTVLRVPYSDLDSLAIRRSKTSIQSLMAPAAPKSGDAIFASIDRVVSIILQKSELMLFFNIYFLFVP